MQRLRFLEILVLLAAVASAQDATLRGHVEVVHQSKHRSGNAEVVVWLTPLQPVPALAPAPVVRLIQKDKRFSPHVIAVHVGAEVEFPNKDPFFHDVFSIYRGKPFDLGLYESGTARKVRFSQPGVSYIFCNIHPEMSAAVVALQTPYFAVTGADGNFQINHLAAGRYKMELWYEMASESELTSLSHEVGVGAGQDPPPAAITLHSSDAGAEHLNKYGQQYSADKPKSY